VLFTKGYSTVVFAENGSLLGARLSPDEQWRFPLVEQLPAKLETALLQQEDQYFYHHPGFNPVALFRALYLNFKKGRVVSGGSTLSMQVVRISRNNPARTYVEKLLEIIRATRLEVGYSKKEILALYATHAPFGGNTVGAETAAWRYYGRALNELSWAEAATLAVLPNAPGLINVGRNRQALKNKRNALLKKLWQAKKIDAATYQLALLEPVPQAPKPLPQSALHLTQFLSKKQAGKRLVSTLSVTHQEQLQTLVNAHAAQMQKAKIYHAAALLIENTTGQVKAYVGNRNSGAGFYNDMLQTPRSSGSILKPFLYQAMLASGELYPKQLVADVPVFLGDYQPKNFINSFDGAVPANEALTRSLNIPAVLQLKDFGVNRFLKTLRKQGFSTLRYNANHYGLSLILGGAEVTAWDLGKAYHRLAANQIFELGDSLPAVHLLKAQEKQAANFLDKGASYTTLNVLTGLVRPSTEAGWQRFGQQKIAWKTGTSFGFRDAWAVGVSAKYTCVVWVGNASGEGRPGLVGATAAGPLLFRILNAFTHG
jgi:penicillin-binding protein 1C